VNRRQPLLTIIDPAQIASGLQPDRHGLGQPLWEAAANVAFYQGKVRRLVPAALMFASGDVGASRGLSQHQSSTGVRWVWTATGGKVRRWYGPAAELIVDMSAGYQANQTSQKPATFFDFTHWGDWTIINSGYGPAQLYKPGDPTFSPDDLPNAPPDTVQFLKLRNQLLAVGCELSQKAVGWSDADHIDIWENDGTNAAGLLTIEELDTGIRAATHLGQYIACYSEDQLGIVYWIGSPAYFGQRVLLDGIGAVGKLAVCSDGNYNYGVSRNGCWRTDGNTYDYIDQGVLNDYLQATVNWAQGSKIQCVRNDVRRCIDFFFPVGEGLEPTEGWTFDPATNGWSPIPAFQVGVERKLFRQPLFGQAGSVYLAEDNPDLAAPLTLRTKPMLVQTADGVTLHISSKIDEVELALKAASNVQFRYGVADDINDEFHWTRWQDINTTLKTYQIEAGTPTGTFHKLEFRNIEDNWDLDLQGFALYGISDGLKRNSL
jgi:hypothetical protein